MEAGSLVAFPGSASPGAPNYLATSSGPVINEILAINRTLVENGRIADWIEIYNPLDGSVDLSGMSLSLDAEYRNPWFFPAGVTIAPHAYLRIWCDPAQAPSLQPSANLNFGQSLPGNGGSVYLWSSTGQILDHVDYGFQIPDKSIGRNGASWALLATPTPGTREWHSRYAGDWSSEDQRMDGCASFR